MLIETKIDADSARSALRITATEMPADASNWNDCLQHAAITDIGMRRSNNQDSHSVVPAGDIENWMDRGHLFVVCDGMGAHAAGELASKLAADGIPHAYYRYRDESPPEALLKAIRETNAQIHTRGRENSDFHNMGTTASAMLLLPQGALVAHVGDSRVYRWRQDVLEQLTFDHSLVWEMRAAGQFPEGDPNGLNVPSNVITRSLGPHPAVQVDLEGPLPVHVGDTYLLCSDGLTGKVSDDEIGPILGALSPLDAAQVLVDLANLRGGPDNITVIVLSITGQRIATGAVDAEPLSVGGGKNEKGVHPALWVVIGICFMAALFLRISGLIVPAALAAMGGIVAAAVGVIQRFGNLFPDKEVRLTGRKRLGHGPHTNLQCPANASFVNKLDEIGEELRRAAQAAKWALSWEPFDECVRNAQEAAASQDHTEAVRRYAQAISYIMQETRSAQMQSASDSSIEY